MTHSNSIIAVQQQLIDNFALLGDWTERYKYIIDLGNQLPSFPEQWRKEEYKVPGCLSQVWLHAELVDDKLSFQATSDSAIVCGLIALLLKVYNLRTPAEILTHPPDFIQQIGLDKHLSPGRSNGLYAMLNSMQKYAHQYLSSQ